MICREARVRGLRRGWTCPGQVFAALPDDLRRPVELIGLIQLLLGARPDYPSRGLPDTTAGTAPIE